MTNRRPSRLERAVGRAVRLEFARRSNWNLNVNEAPTRPMELTESTLATLEKIFPTRETLHKEMGIVKSELRAEIGALEGKIGTLGGKTGTLDGKVDSLEEKLETLDGKVGSLRLEMHTEFNSLRVEMAKIPFETIKWFFTFSGIIAAIFFGASHLM